MSTPLAHDYIGLSETSIMERSSEKNPSPSSSSTISEEDEKNGLLILKETELRLGLPGSESPERKAGPGNGGLSIFGKDFEDMTNGFSLGPLKNFVSGAKRGFSDTINGSSKWDFSCSGRSEVDLGKSEILFSPKGGNSLSNDSNISLLSGPSKKEAAAPTSKPVEEQKECPASEQGSAPATKAQVVGWPPIRSFRKNTLATSASKKGDVEGKSGPGCLYVKVSMDGAPYLRKVDLKTYHGYVELSSALEKMFSCFTIGQCSSHGLPGQEGLSESNLVDLLHGSEYVLTYEDKDGDWMLVGDVPWEMFTESCKRLRIMKGSEAIGLAPRAIQKCKNQF